MAGPVNGGQILNPNWNSGSGAPMAPTFVNGFKQSNVQSGANATCTVPIPAGTTVVPTLNVAAPVAGRGGDQWGAYGGGITPVGGNGGVAVAGNGFTKPVSLGGNIPGPTGWAPPIEQTVGNAETAADFTFGQMNASAAQGRSVLAGMSSGALPVQTPDTMYADASVLATADCESITADTQL
jgi:hypothetical protein